MRSAYTIGIHFYGLILRLAALSNRKARQWVNGRVQWDMHLHGSLAQLRNRKPNSKLAWFHCASVGEFEQGRPVMEAFRKKFPDHLILLTFFSPSGYELRKNYAGADVISYLPLDTPRNVKKFLGITKPDMAFFVKYEFWFNYLHTLQTQKIPHYLVSGIFRADQHFFKWYGDWPRGILRGFTHIFVQNEYSRELLEFVGISNASVSGDTRFDRVLEIAGQRKDLPLIESFCGEEMVMVAGSTWPADQELLLKLVKNHGARFKLILVPHEIHEEEIIALKNSCGTQAIRYSEAGSASVADARILIIDTIGLLSQIYRYGTLAYIGGGFGVGIHNILEAAVFGMPVIFGPNYHKFHEATELVGVKGGFPVHQYPELEKTVLGFLNDRALLHQTAVISKTYVLGKQGATKHILDTLSK